jgi:hypothetical protein
MIKHFGVSGQKRLATAFNIQSSVLLYLYRINDKFPVYRPDCSNQTSPSDDPTLPVTSAGPGSEQDTTGSTLYIGFYLPELEMADLTNCNAASYPQWTFQEKTA